MTEEFRAMLKVLRGVERDLTVVEVGSGYGGKLNFLKSIGFYKLIGVEKNQALVNRSRDEGLEVYTPETFSEKFADQKFDMLVLSHIIEHFQYDDLKDFIEYYGNFLKDGGLLLLATPTLNPNFFDDFDHVKPYSHLGLLSVFGDDDGQIQFYSPIRLRLLDLRYVRLAYQLKYYRALTLRTSLYRIPRLANQLLHLAYRLTFRLFGRPVAWVALFEKSTKTMTSQENDTP